MTPLCCAQDAFALELLSINPDAPDRGLAGALRVLNRTAPACSFHLKVHQQLAGSPSLQVDQRSGTAEAGVQRTLRGSGALQNGSIERTSYTPDDKALLEEVVRAYALHIVRQVG